MRNAKKTLSVVSLLLLSTFTMAQGDDGGTLQRWFGVLELPFLVLCMYFALRTAGALKGGIFGKGMILMAWGFVVMGVGHLHLQINHWFGVNIFNTIFGVTLGQLIWFIALVVTWTLSGLGFYYIFKAARVA